MVLLSIVVPVYNVEKYLHKCLDSVLRQGLKENEYEVLLINDGSKDASRNICLSYTSNHPNFRLIDQDNQGVAAARNNGIEHADGKFIAFLDSDDYLLDDGLKMAFSPFAERDDIDVIHYYSSYDFWDKKPIDNTLNFEGRAWDLIINGGLPSFCWIYVYKKDFLNKENIRFKQYVVGEDSLFTSTVFLANPYIVSTKADIYRYVVREDSASTRRTVSFSRKSVKDYLNSHRNLLAILEKYQVSKREDVYVASLNSINSKKIFGISRIWSSEYHRKEFLNIKKCCKEYNFIPVFPYAKGLKSTMACVLMNFSMSNYLAYKISSWLFNHVIAAIILPYIRTRFKR